VLHRPRKRLGQHFLIDRNIVRKILTTAAVSPQEAVCEIGPGRGILTEALCRIARTVIAIELDPRLCKQLAERLTDCGNLELHHGDARDFPYEQLPKGTVVVANLPYYISTPLLFKLFEAHERIDRMVLMLQLEVARRLVAQPNSSDYGILSVLAQYWSEPALAFRVPASCFHPRPEVDSAVVAFKLRRERARQGDHEAFFIRLVRTAFAHRRKTLANSLRDLGMEAAAIDRALATAGIVPSRRAETLSLNEFAALAQALSSTCRRAS
jgi:16S rRNA (adenine1518-N6/adenine1519-N6)-dimethyltransferase